MTPDLEAEEMARISARAVLAERRRAGLPNEPRTLMARMERDRATEAAGYVSELDGGPVMFARVFGAGLAIVVVVGCAMALWSFFKAGGQ